MTNVGESEATQGARVGELGPLIIRPSGDLDYYSAASLRAEIHKGLAQNNRGLIVSLEDVAFMDSKRV